MSILEAPTVLGFELDVWDYLTFLTLFLIQAAVIKTSNLHRANRIKPNLALAGSFDAAPAVRIAAL
ncbi:MAG: hypothetical protein WCA32_04480 [Chromatiaceae bacterium]